MDSEPYISPLLAVAAISVVFVTLIALFCTELPFAERLRWLLDRHAQKGMLAIAGVAMASSLYYSEIVGFVPCEFCWLQRIEMYPLAVLLLVTVVTRGRFEPKYIVTLAAIGLGFSLYQYQLQVFPNQAEICSGGVSCSGRYVNQFGFVTIPFMAGCGFLSVLILQLAEWRTRVVYRRWYGWEEGSIASAVGSGIDGKAAGELL